MKLMRFKKKKEMDQLNAEKSNFFALFGLP